jgi:hypothetical protein
LLLLLQVMPVHGTRNLPGSETITSNIPKLMASFDPSKPLTFEVSVKSGFVC